MHLLILTTTLNKSRYFEFIIISNNLENFYVEVVVRSEGCNVEFDYFKPKFWFEKFDCCLQSRERLACYNVTLTKATIMHNWMERRGFKIRKKKNISLWKDTSEQKEAEAWKANMGQVWTKSASKNTCHLIKHHYLVSSSVKIQVLKNMFIFFPKSRTTFNISKKVCATFGECAQFHSDHKKLRAKNHLRQNKKQGIINNQSYLSLRSCLVIMEEKHLF